MLVSEVPAFKEYWYPVAYSGEIADKPRAVRLLGDNYVVWRGKDGTLGCAVDECPHRAARLSQGWLEDGEIVCPYHGWAFNTVRRLHPHSPAGRRPADPAARAHAQRAGRRALRSGLGLPGHPARRHSGACRRPRIRRSR